MSSPDVIVVDDHYLIRKGVAVLVEELGWTVVGQAASLAQARDCVATMDWSVLVLDLNLPDGDGLEFLKEVRAAGHKQPILIHSYSPDTAVATQVFKAGGSGFISKSCEPEDFQAACRKVLSGGRYVSSEYAEALAMGLATGETSNPHEKLSAREYQVLCLFGAGKKPAEVAAVLGCHVNTISTFRARILDKLQLKNTMEIIRYALSHQLVSL